MHRSFDALQVRQSPLFLLHRLPSLTRRKVGPSEAWQRFQHGLASFARHWVIHFHYSRELRCQRTYRSAPDPPGGRHAHLSDVALSLFSL